MNVERSSSSLPRAHGQSMGVRMWVVCALGLLALVGGCGRLPQIGVTALKPSSLEELQRHLLAQRPDVEQFRLRGPFAVTVREDLELRLAQNERYPADAYLSAAPGSAPLVVLLHGHDNGKEDHAYHGYHLASWGLHCLSVQLPNNGPWLKNGAILARLVRFIQQRPEAVDRRIDVKRIILVGHSFGGFAAAIALAEGAPAIGGILLDPAGMGSQSLPRHLRKIQVPVMVLGSDGDIETTRMRGVFYQSIRSNVADVSIKGAGHDDAVFPLASGLWGSDANEEMQLSFVAALAAAAFSLGSTGKLDYAWASYAEALKTGKLIDPMRK